MRKELGIGEDVKVVILNFGGQVTAQSFYEDFIGWFLGVRCTDWFRFSFHFEYIIRRSLFAAVRLDIKGRVPASRLALPGILCFTVGCLVECTEIFYHRGLNVVFFLDLGLWFFWKSEASSKFCEASKRFVYSWSDCCIWLHAWLVNKSFCIADFVLTSSGFHSILVVFYFYFKLRIFLLIIAAL